MTDTTQTETGQVVATSTPEWSPEAILDSFNIAEIVERQVAEALAKQQQQTGNPIVHAEQRVAQANVPEKYLKHYRCDVSDEGQIKRRRYDPTTDKLYDDPELKGKYIKFRRGHYFATDQDVVDQLEWMMRNHTVNPSTGEVIGGMMTIYEDDGRDLVRCEYCDEPFVRNSNAYKAHKRATHGVE
jgi:hypothetical protein